MKAKHSHITFVLDRSASMRAHLEQTITGFNAFLAEQKKVAGSCTVTLLQFDYPERHHYVYTDQDIQKVPDLTEKTFSPRGNTALVDAIGHAIDDTGRALAGLADAERPERVYIVILTDGEENASREYAMKPEVLIAPQGTDELYKQLLGGYVTQGAMLPKREPKGIVSEMIQHQKDKYNWDFIFLGADQDAIKTASQLNINAGTTLSYNSSHLGTQSAFTATAQNVAESRTINANTRVYGEGQRKQALQADDAK